eukprot:CAMPEP_0201282800 /NCGR_PEP_ID=MMETSP1317-20130820/6687_1 /ASSEMBLY_ACC=CAM_ASM_000770 /TAXON_ID=187299 /ORGANISM="Undescribed Undescribed, Strain Undescribed" /LENGTH=46 /DNA_ID= /DNA_START= /DNA_END= /DNA_ORIENTATION=
MRHGKGVCHFNNGDVYDGTWSLDIIHGEGKMNYANGDVYEGEWENG